MTPAPAIPSVCHVAISLAPGGLETLVVLWTNARNAAHPGSTSVACLDAEGELAGLLQPSLGGAPIRCLHARRSRVPWDAAAVRRLRAQLLDGPGGAATIVHSHNLAAQQYAALAVRGTSVRHVHTEHGSNVHMTGIVNRLRLRGLACATDVLVAVSADTAARMAPLWSVPRARIRVIPNGVPPHIPVDGAALAALRRELALPEGAPVIGAVGRLATVKGFDRLLATVPEIQRRVPQVQVVIVGDGPERARLEAQADRLGVRGAVRFAGFRRDARALVDLFDAFVAPSRSEGLPLALLEVMAAGCPALVTDAGEQRAVLRDGALGFILPSDEARWADAIAACLTGEGRVEARRRAGVAREVVRTDYGLDRTVNAYEALYAELAEAAIVR